MNIKILKAIYTNYYRIASYLLFIDVVLFFLFEEFFRIDIITRLFGYLFWFLLGGFLSLISLKFLEKKIGVVRRIEKDE